MFCADPIAGPFPTTNTDQRHPQINSTPRRPTIDSCLGASAIRSAALVDKPPCSRVSGPQDGDPCFIRPTSTGIVPWNVRTPSPADVHFRAAQNRSTVRLGFSLIEQSGQQLFRGDSPVKQQLKRQSAIGVALLALGFGGSCLAAEGQKAVVIHAGQMFDSHAARLVSKQVIVIQGDRIDDVGAEGSVRIPLGAEEIDLGAATVLPGLIEGHNHMFKVGDYPGSGSDAVVPLEVKPGTPFSPGYITLLAAKNAKLDLESGFTTARDLSSGSTLDVDLRNAINQGIVPGPRMVIATEGIRGSIAGPRYFHLIDSPYEGRKQVRVQLKNGADFIKVYAAGIRANPAMGYGAPTMTAEEQNAIVDEAHRQGVRVACTAHAGIAVQQSIEAGCDSLELVTDIDEQSVRMLVEKGTYINFGLTITKLQATHQDFPMAEMSRASFQRALKAGAKIVL